MATHRQTGEHAGADVSASPRELDEAALALAQGGGTAAPAVSKLGGPVGPAAAGNPPRSPVGINVVLADGSVRG